jgi:formate dehydrogenase maturation protein FdhE
MIDKAFSREEVGSFWQQRADRARHLASRSPASHDILIFIAELNAAQEQITRSVTHWGSLLGCRELVSQLVERRGPLPLRETAQSFDDAACEQALRRYWTCMDTESTRSFFARALLQTVLASGKQGIVADHLGTRPAQMVATRCPQCGDLPQVGCLRTQGHGKSQSLCCSLCFHEWPYPRAHCAACGEHSENNLSYYDSPGFHHFQLQACESCHRYLLTVDLSSEPAAIPDIDELVALPLNLWIQEQGYRRIQLNLIGI